MSVKLFVYSEGEALVLDSNDGVICDVFRKEEIITSGDIFTCVITTEAEITPDIKIESGESFAVTLCGATVIPYELNPLLDHLSVQAVLYAESTLLYSTD